MPVASALSWESVLTRASAPPIDELLIIVMTSSIVELPICMFRDRGDINEVLSSINLSRPVYSERRALTTEGSVRVGYQRWYTPTSCRKMSQNGFISARVMSHQVTLKKSRKKSIGGADESRTLQQLCHLRGRLAGRDCVAMESERSIKFKESNTRPLERDSSGLLPFVFSFKNGPCLEALVS